MRIVAAAILAMLPIIASAATPASASPGTAAPAPAMTGSGPAMAGQMIAFDREKGNCLACHVIAGGELPGNIGPELKHVKTLVQSRKQLYAIIYDEQKRNPRTIMPAFGKNGILTPKQINDVIDFLYTK
jgi:sulfur-oxidizing protein SoxX